MTIFLVIALLAVVAAVVINRRRVKAATVPDEILSCPEFEAEYVGEPDLDAKEPDFDNKVLLGEYSTNVAYLQRTLNRNYGSALKVDGKAGCDTFDAVYELTGLNLSDGVDLNDLNTEE